ncbi:MAG TPA: DUF1697 domain-containing protein [Halobacteriales archaeon]|nr:DUF1697 domain-containing protein [Halobacteriales archaeon]
MTTYVAFLRGINVGGHNRMKMDALCDLVESLGYGDVRTYIQSGNVVFEAAEADDRALADDLAAAIDDEFGYDVTVMVRTLDELAAIVEGQPFAVTEEEGIRHYVTFLHDEPSEDGIDALLDAARDGETFEVVGREVYSELDKNVMSDGRYTDAGAKLGTPATRRYWDVVTSVLELASP